MVFVRGFMKIVSGLGVLSQFCLIACAPSASNEIPAPSQDKPQLSAIVGGHEVTDFSIISKNVALLVNAVTGEVCTATLLGGPFALTAAHCLETAQPSELYIFFGTKPNRHSQRRQVIATKISPYWELRKFEDKNTGDIAVLRFSGNDLPSGYEAAKFLENEALLRNSASSLVLGYGINDALQRTGAGKLRFTTLLIKNRQYSTTEVVLDQSRGSGACHGDSGGPAFVMTQDSLGRSQYYLWGIANHATKDDINNHCNTGVIYTNVTLFKTWIQIALQSL